ncbi:adhesion G protein-coupled receptor E3-like [Actinia tenebrosa]|uniref:Adhesion G protein-coupled receptor E3-like n=1 Tax=Actinia tenebrosa TaxID=6105 RepID=A0A6P8J1R8_ACTTE|nr:adhesion G protein-coupled receptor E3-like [Actinia tenebrosa]
MHLGFVLVNSCPMSAHQRQSSKLCKQANQFNKLDILTSVPVFDLLSNKSYGNVFCASCSQRKTLAMWRVEAACNRTVPKETSQSELLKFIVSSHCTISSSPPSSVSVSRHRICVPRHKHKQYASIDDSSHTQKLRELCDSYAFPVCAITPDGNYLWFKNPHCLLFHGIFDMQDAHITCPSSDRPLPPLTILFDFRSTTNYVISRQLKDQDTPEEVMEKELECKEDHVFDAFTGKCRRIFESKSNCDLIKLEKSEYRIFQNGSLLFRGTMHTDQSYSIINGTVSVCVNLTKNYTVLESRFGKSSKLLDPITGLSISGCALSLISLLLLIISYLVLPDLRNLPGKIVLNIAVSMFAYLLLFFFINRTERPLVCRAIAISLHFFFLSMFFWMNVMAFDIHSTFTRKGNVDFKRRSPGCCAGLYLKYALYGWLGPLMIVVVSSGLDISQVYNVYIGYGSRGDEYCYINNPYAKLYTVVVPVGVILLYNCVALCHTVIHIKNVRKQTSTVANQSHQPGLPVVCIKMTSVIGVSWILGYLASSQSTAFLWYPYVVLNSLQGFLIFISYVLNRRVLKMYKAILLEMRGKRNSVASKRSTNMSPA